MGKGDDWSGVACSDRRADSSAEESLFVGVCRDDSFGGAALESQDRAAAHSVVLWLMVQKTVAMALRRWGSLRQRACCGYRRLRLSTAPS